MTHPSLAFLSFERPAFLRDAILSALDGCDEPVEVIVHDDGSLDPTVPSLLYAFLNEGLISRLVLNAPGHNEGKGRSMNVAAGMMTGDPLIFIDQDLVFKSGWLARVRHILEDRCVGTLGLFRYEHDPVDWRKMRIAEKPGDYHYCKDFCGSALVIPRCVWNILGPFDEYNPVHTEDAVWKQWVYEQPGLFNALPNEDLVTNRGFGIGPSTVVVANPETGAPEPSQIHDSSFLVKR